MPKLTGLVVGKLLLESGNRVHNNGVKTVYDHPRFPHNQLERAAEQSVIHRSGVVMPRLVHQLSIQLHTTKISMSHLLNSHLSAVSPQPTITTTTYI